MNLPLMRWDLDSQISCCFNIIWPIKLKAAPKSCIFCLLFIAGPASSINRAHWASVYTWWAVFKLLGYRLSVDWFLDWTATYSKLSWFAIREAVLLLKTQLLTFPFWNEIYHCHRGKQLWQQKRLFQAAELVHFKMCYRESFVKDWFIFDWWQYLSYLLKCNLSN